MSSLSFKPQPRGTSPDAMLSFEEATVEPTTEETQGTAGLQETPLDLPDLWGDSLVEIALWQKIERVLDCLDDIEESMWLFESPYEPQVAFHAGVKGSYAEAMHPRGRAGMWIRKLGGAQHAVRVAAQGDLGAKAAAKSGEELAAMSKQERDQLRLERRRKSFERQLKHVKHAQQRAKLKSVPKRLDSAMGDKLMEILPVEALITLHKMQTHETANHATDHWDAHKLFELHDNLQTLADFMSRALEIAPHIFDGAFAALVHSDEQELVDYLFELAESAHWEPARHPRWPKGAPDGLGGQFMRVGQRFELGGVDYDVAAVFPDHIYAHVATHGHKGTPGTVRFDTDQIEDFDVDPEGAAKPEAGGKVKLPTIKGVVRPAAEPLKSGGKDTLNSNETVVDPYVDPSSHDDSIPLPEGSALTEEQWKQFGQIDQERYAQLQELYGKWSPGATQTVLNKVKSKYSGDSALHTLESLYSSQYGSSTGFTVSLVSFFSNVLGLHKKEPQVEKTWKEYERARAIQDDLSGVLQWDLYNRVRAADIAIFHRNTTYGLFDKIIHGYQPVFSGLSQSQKWSPSHNTGFGHNTFATPMAIRHIALSSVSANVVSNGYQHELEVATRDLYRADERSMIFGPDGTNVNSMQTKWLEGVTKAGAPGSVIAELKESFKDNGYSLPVPPAAAEIVMDSEGGKQWIDPPNEATEFADTPDGKKSVLEMKYAETDKNGIPIAHAAKDLDLKPGDYIEGMKGTRYLIVADPSEAIQLRYYKITTPGTPSGPMVPYTEGKIHDAATGNQAFAGHQLDKSGESYAFESDGVLPFKKLLGHTDLPAADIEEGAEFHPDAWTLSGNGTEKFLAKFDNGEKFTVNGVPYEVLDQLGSAQVRIRNLLTNKPGKINNDYKSQHLVLKDGYSETGVPAIDPNDYFHGDKQELAEIKPQPNDLILVGMAVWKVTSQPGPMGYPVVRMNGTQIGKTNTLEGTVTATKLVEKPPGWQTPEPGAILALDGKKATLTKVMKNGDLQFNTHPGVVKLKPGDPRLVDLFDEKDWTTGEKMKLKAMAPGQKFHGGSGVKVKPYEVVENPETGKFVKVKNLETGEVTSVGKLKSYQPLHKKLAFTQIVHDEALAVPEQHTVVVNTDAFEFGGAKKLGELDAGEHFLWHGNVWEATGEGHAKNLTTGQTAELHDPDFTVPLQVVKGQGVSKTPIDAPSSEVAHFTPQEWKTDGPKFLLDPTQVKIDKGTVVQTPQGIYKVVSVKASLYAANGKVFEVEVLTSDKKKPGTKFSVASTIEAQVMFPKNQHPDDVPEVPTAEPKTLVKTPEKKEVGSLDYGDHFVYMGEPFELVSKEMSTTGDYQVVNATSLSDPANGIKLAPSHLVVPGDIVPPQTLDFDPADYPALSGYVNYMHPKSGKKKYPHVKDMPEGIVFHDKSGKKLKVLKGGNTAVVTDGKEVYSLDGELRGFVIDEKIDTSAMTPLGKVGEIDPEQVANAHGLNQNQSNKSMHELGIKPGDQVLFDTGPTAGKVAVVHSVDPETTSVAFVTADGIPGAYLGSKKPVAYLDYIGEPITNDAPPEPEPEPVLLGSETMKVGDSVTPGLLKPGDVFDTGIGGDFAAQYTTVSVEPLPHGPGSAPMVKLTLKKPTGKVLTVSYAEHEPIASWKFVNHEMTDDEKLQAALKASIEPGAVYAPGDSVNPALLKVGDVVKPVGTQFEVVGVEHLGSGEVKLSIKSALSGNVTSKTWSNQTIDGWKYVGTTHPAAPEKFAVGEYVQTPSGAILNIKKVYPHSGGLLGKTVKGSDDGEVPVGIDFGVAAQDVAGLKKVAFVPDAPLPEGSASIDDYEAGEKGFLKALAPGDFFKTATGTSPLQVLKVNPGGTVEVKNVASGNTVPSVAGVTAVQKLTPKKTAGLDWSLPGDKSFEEIPAGGYFEAEGATWVKDGFDTASIVEIHDATQKAPVGYGDKFKQDFKVTPKPDFGATQFDPSEPPTKITWEPPAQFSLVDAEPGMVVKSIGNPGIVRLLEPTDDTKKVWKGILLKPAYASKYGKQPGDEVQIGNAYGTWGSTATPYVGPLWKPGEKVKVTKPGTKTGKSGLVIESSKDGITVMFADGSTKVVQSDWLQMAKTVQYKTVQAFKEKIPKTTAKRATIGDIIGGTTTTYYSPLDSKWVVTAKNDDGSIEVANFDMGAGHSTKTFQPDDEIIRLGTVLGGQYDAALGIDTASPKIQDIPIGSFVKSSALGGTVYKLGVGPEAGKVSLTNVATGDATVADFDAPGAGTWKIVSANEAGEYTASYQPPPGPGDVVNDLSTLPPGTFITPALPNADMISPVVWKILSHGEKASGGEPGTNMEIAKSAVFKTGGEKPVGETYITKTNDFTKWKVVDPAELDGTPPPKTVEFKDLKVGDQFETYNKKTGQMDDSHPVYEVTEVSSTGVLGVKNAETGGKAGYLLPTFLSAVKVAKPSEPTPEPEPEPEPTHADTAWEVGDPVGNWMNLSEGDWVKSPTGNLFQAAKIESIGDGHMRVTWTDQAGGVYPTNYGDAFDAASFWTHADPPPTPAGEKAAAPELVGYKFPHSNGKKFPKIGTLAVGTAFQDKTGKKFKVSSLPIGGIIFYEDSTGKQKAISSDTRVYPV